MHKLLFFSALLCLLAAAKLTAQIVGDDTDIVWKFKPINKIGAMNSSFTPDSKYILVGHTDSTLRIYDVETGEMTKEIPDVTLPTFSRDGKLLAVKSLTKIFIYNYPTLELYKELDSPDLTWGIDESPMSFSPDAKHLATAERDSGIYIWDLETGKGEKILDLYGFGTAYSEDGTKLLFSTFRNPGVYDFETKTYKGLGLYGARPLYSPDYKHFALENNRNPDSMNKYMDVYNSTTFELENRFNIGSSFLEYKFSNDSKYLVVGHSGTGLGLKVFSLAESKRIKSYAVNKDTIASVVALSLSPDNQYVFSQYNTYFILFKANWENTDVKEKTGTSKSMVFPNPIDNIANMELISKESGKAKLLVLNSKGETVDKKEIEWIDAGRNIIKYNCEKLLSGAYYAHIIIGKETFTFNMIKR